MIWALVALVVLFALYAFGLYGVAYFCLHPPRIPLFMSLSALGLPQESVVIESTDNLELRGWWLHHDDPKAVFVMAHGYLMNRAEPVPLARRLYELGFSCLLFDFRAHGFSDGKKSSIGYVERYDVAAAFEEARRKYPHSKIILWGSSMGGAASVFAISEEGIRPDGLIMDSVYSRLLEANLGWWKTFAGHHYRWLRPSWLFCWLISGMHPHLVDVGVALAKTEKIPILMMYGDLDMIAPVEEAQRNHSARPDAQLVWFEGCQHSQPRWIQTEKYDRHLEAFVDEVIGTSENGSSV